MADQTPNVTITTVRGILGATNPLAHTRAQLRAGFMDLDMKNASDVKHSDIFGLGGHLHLASKRWYGMMVGIEGYAVVDPGLNNDDLHRIDTEFFDANGDSFVTLSQGYLDGLWGHTELKIGRQALDTPHADSDDIRMMPNYFLAYMLSNRDIDGLTLRIGKIEQMGGWENGIDASKFVSVEKVLGADEKTDGIYVASAQYEGIENLSLQAWYYAIDEIADVLYLEAGYEVPMDRATLTLGLQYDGASDRGDALIGDVDAKTFGISAETGFENGLTLLIAYNTDRGKGAFGSLGGGPFFTSLEDQTLDAIGAEGDAWIVGGSYDFENIGWQGLQSGIVYGRFTADEKDRYKRAETDLVCQYHFGDRFDITAAYAIVDDRTAADDDYNLFRLIANYNFKADFQ